MFKKFGKWITPAKIPQEKLIQKLIKLFHLPNFIPQATHGPDPTTPIKINTF